ncbi:hypothetical protein M0Q03_03675, partial [bacterium]|jgi:putative hemolysin|nr:hypothetical protein [bacterium]
VQSRLNFTFQKLDELRNIKNDRKAVEVALAGYLLETENLKLSAESLRGMNNSKLANKIIDELFYQRQVLANVLGVEKNDLKNYALMYSFNNLISSAFYVGSEDDIFKTIKSHIDTIESAQLKIEELDYILAYSPTATFKEYILSLQLEIIEDRIASGFIDTSESNYFESKFLAIRNTEYYKKMTIALEKKKQEDLIQELTKGVWIDEVFSRVPGEEVEILQDFKMRLAKIKLEKLDQKIDDLQVYEDTKILLKEAKNEIIASIYGEMEPTQTLSVLQDIVIKNDSITTSPSSAYCLRLGYELGEREKDGTKYTVCFFGNQECEELAFYKGECKFIEDSVE